MRSDSVGLADVRDAWNVTLAELRKRSVRIAALLNPSKPVAFDGDTLRVEVQSRYHRDEMSGGPSKELLGESLHAALGIKPQLQFVARGEEPAEEDDAQVADVAETEAVEESDAVELVKKGLAAEVVEERSNL